MTETRMHSCGLAIESGVPAPDQRRPGMQSRFPFADMEVGESVLISKEYATRDQVRYACCHLQQTRPGWHFERRSNSAGVRVWRTR